MRSLLISLAMILILFLAGSVVAWRSLQSKLEPIQTVAPSKTFVVKRGASLRNTAKALETNGLIQSARALELWSRITKQSNEIRAGEYDLSASQSATDILETLTQGETKHYTLVLPEGLTVKQSISRIAELGLVKEAELTKLAFDPQFTRSLGIPAKNLEGYLFPESYRLERGISAQELLQHLVEHFFSLWKELQAKAKERNLSMHQVVTLASIVEKETSKSAERPRIAGVFHNRLKRGMKLESDPTVIYGIPNFDGNLRRIHLEDGSNVYNTYRIPALPPGPIANPGADALRAVVEPESNQFIFFVSKNDGTHFFSKTYREHVNAVNRYQRRKK